MQLSKSDYLLFLKHPAWLWLKKHDKSKLPPIDDVLQAIFDTGHEFEEYANKLFSDGVRLGFNPEIRGDYNDLLIKTKQAVESDIKTIFQGRFLVGDITCIVDILDRVSGFEFDLYEIKSSTEVKPENIDDLAFQTVVLENTGLKVRKVFVIHVNNKYVRDGEIDIQGITSITNVTDDVRYKVPETRALINEALEVMRSKLQPNLSPRYLKSGPLDEWMEIYKLINKNIDPHSIYNLGGLSAKAIGELEDLGVDLIKDIPEDFKLSTRQMRQVKATKLDERIIDQYRVKKFLDNFEYPLYFLDYETFSSLIPPFDGLKPYDQIPFQYSLHILESKDKPLIHKEYLHKEFSHPGLPLLQKLRQDIGDKGSVIVWHDTFEKGRNERLGELFSDYYDFMQSVNSRIIDLKTPFSEGWVIDKDFFGSASIKKVLPVIVTELSYKNLEIKEGTAAQRLWMDTIFQGKNVDKKDKIMEDLIEYCKLDTMAMVQLFLFLTKLEL